MLVVPTGLTEIAKGKAHNQNPNTRRAYVPALSCAYLAAFYFKA